MGIKQLEREDTSILREKAAIYTYPYRYSASPVKDGALFMPLGNITNHGPKRRRQQTFGA